MSFRIAGIKILHDCKPYVRKILKENEVYLFSSRYNVTPWNELTLSFNRNIMENLYYQMMYDIQRDTGTLEVSVNAIVGQNGDGKSTLLEVMLRILNNFAYAQGFREDQPTLKFVEGVNAILYYEIDSDIYAIKCIDREVTWFKNGESIILLEGADSQKKRFIKQHYVPDLFYAMVINYSLYAYTPASLGNATEEGYWIDGLFHKNDSYQTPVVLNPMRTRGSIDIIREEYLSKQRLMSIFVSSDDDEKERMVSNNEKAVGYAFSLEKESKFLIKTLNKYFHETFQDELIWDDMRPYEYSNEKIPGEITDRFMNFWGSFQFELAENPKLVKECGKILSNQRRARKTDLRKYLTLINNTVYPVNNKASKKRQGGFGREFGMLVNSRSGELYMLNYRQFYRLMLIFLIWRALTETDKYAMKGARLNDALSDTGNPRNAAMLYLVYKFISIAETYQGFCNAYYLTEEKYTPLIREWPNRDALGTIKQDLELIMRTNDYRTLKFKQTLNYLKQRKEYYGAELCDMPGINYDYFLSFDGMNNQMKGISLKEIQWRLPCPIFEGDIILYDGKDYYPLDTLSSGMIQRLNTVGSLVYHLRNLDDNQEGEGMLAYERVCVVLEEVELYYHPEYQKSYLNYLLEQISRAGINRLKSVNLVFVTHSPFILSDITKNDILCLENGKRADLELKTFGANIHDLLRHPFFMKKGTIGDFAQKVINEIIVSLSIYEAIKKSGNKPFNIRMFKEHNPELVESMGFLPLEEDGSLSMINFEVQYSQRTIREAISLLDEPIIKNALQREYNRIFS